MIVGFLGNFGVSYSSETHHAASLEALGHTVTRLQEPHTPADQIADLDCDMFVWIKTHGWDTPGIERAIDSLKARRVPIVTYHLDLYMGLPRWNRYQHDPYLLSLDHFFTVDKNMAEWLSSNTPVRGHFLPAGVFDQECYLAEPSALGNDVVFVGSRGYHPEWTYRPQLIDWLRATYGRRFTHVGGDGDTGTIRGHDLNRLYAGSKVAVGDTLCPNFTYPYYASDRLFEAPGRGAFQIFPRITGLNDWFTDGETIAFYEFGDFTGLKEKIDHYIEADEDRERIRKAGHEHVLANHTYVERWQTILDTVFG